MRVPRRLAVKPRWAGLIVLILIVLLTRPGTEHGYASDQTLFTREVRAPVGIAGGFRGGPKLRVTSPYCNDQHREIYEVDSTGHAQVIAIILDGRPRRGCFKDSITVPLQLSKTTLLAFPANSSIVALGKKIFLIPAACSKPSDTGCTIDASTEGSEFAVIPTLSACPEANVVVDRWGEFNGDVLWTCFFVQNAHPKLEVWRVAPSGTVTLVKTLDGAFSGRPAIAHPLFGSLGRLLLLYRENTKQLVGIKKDGTTVQVGVAGVAGAGSVETLPTVLDPFSSAGGRLFATILGKNEVFQYQGFTNGNPFLSYPPAGVLIITDIGVIVRVDFDSGSGNFASAIVHPTSLERERFIADTELSPVARADIIISQESINNPQGVPRGHIVGFLLSGERFDPLKCLPDKTVCNLLFGFTGLQDSIVKLLNTGTDANSDNKPDLKFFADPDIARCGATEVNGVVVNILCIMTGDIKDPGDRFEAD